MSSLQRHPVLAVALAAVALLIPASLLVPPAHAASRTLTESYAVGSADRLALHIPYGGVAIEAVDGGSVRVRVEGTCDRDEDRRTFLDRLRLESKIRGKTLVVKLDGPTWRRSLDIDVDDDADDDEGSGEHRDHRGRSSLRIVVQVPRALRVDVEMGAGTLEIAGVGKDLGIDLGAGKVIVRMKERSVGSINVDLAVGEVQIHQGGRTRDYARVLSGPIRWNEGTGSAAIDVDLGAGSVDVTLE